MLGKMKQKLHPLLIKHLGRDRLEYFASNTMNIATQAFDSFIWSYQCQAKIIEVRQETADTKTFVLLPNQHFKQPLPGQHIEITVDTDNSGSPTARCYTLSEIQQDTVSITVKNNPDGKVSSWLHQYGRAGMILNISSPRGQFIYRSQEKLLFVSAGSGVTPCFAMLKALESTKKPVDIAFYYRTRNPEQTIFQKQLEQTNQSVTVNFSYSQPKDTSSQAHLPHQLAEMYPDINDRHIYLCGPESFKNEVVAHLQSTGYDLDNLQVENFRPPEVSVDESSRLEGRASVLLKERNIQFEIDAQTNQTILEAAESQGIQLEHGCRTGMCGTCRTRLISGKVSGQQLGNSIYPCTSYPASSKIVLE